MVSYYDHAGKPVGNEFEEFCNLAADYCMKPEFYGLIVSLSNGRNLRILAIDPNKNQFMPIVVQDVQTHQIGCLSVCAVLQLIDKNKNR